MIAFRFDYATPSVLESTRDRATLGLSADRGRPVRFVGRLLRETMAVRFGIQALARVIWSEERWDDDDTFLLRTLDPVVTVAPDRLIFEGFGQDLGTLGILELDRDLFATEGEVRTGTTNVDFTAWLAAAVDELRTSRTSWIRVDPGGLEVRTEAAGGRYEPKVELPEAWVRGLLAAEAAMALPGTRLSVRPVDLLAALRWLSVLKARVSPRALRWVMEPGQDAALILEPWEKRVPLRGATHGYPETRSVRTWGRRRLKLLEPLLPLAERATVYLKGRGLPVFVTVELPGVRFTLGTSTAGFSGLDLLLPDAPDPALVEAVLAALEGTGLDGTGLDGTGLDGTGLDGTGLAARLGRPLREVEAAAARLLRLGRARYDLATRRYGRRELFHPPLPADEALPPDPRQSEARLAVSRGEVTGLTVEARETRKIRRLPTPEGVETRELVLRDHVVEGAVSGRRASVVLGENGRVIFGTCSCAFFAANTLSRGPCAEMLALLHAARDQLADGASSEEAAPPPTPEPLDNDEEEGEE